MTGTRTRTRGPTDAGMVTVETAIALTALVVLFVLAVSGFAAALDQLGCTDAAREAARQVARGDAAAAADVVRELGPSGARLDVRTDGDHVLVDVTLDSGGLLLPGVHPHAHAAARLEPVAVNPADPP